MTKEWDSKPLTQLIKEPWVGRNSITQDWGSAKDKWLASMKGTMVAESGRFSFAFSLIEGMKRVNPYLRVAIVVPTLALQEQWYEEINKTFDFSQGLVGLLGGGHQDTFSAWTRILICLVDAATNTLPVTVDSYLSRDLLLIVDDASNLKDEALQRIYAIPRAYSLGLLTTLVDENYDSSQMGKELGPVIIPKPDSFDVEVCPIKTQDIRYSECNSIRVSDEYFSARISENMLIGDIQLEDDQLKHLSSLIATELRKRGSNLKNSLSVAVFLVWMGILHYQEGNYWSPVYEALGLSKGQSKWQAVFGEAFLGAIRKHGLLEIRERQTFVSSILAHGYVPNYYLNGFFSDCLWPIYVEWIGAGLSVERPEVEHLVSIWRRDVSGFESLHMELTKLEDEENSLSILYEAFQNQEEVRRYSLLTKRMEESKLLNRVLNLPSGWLQQAEEEKNRLQQDCTILDEESRQLTKVENTAAHKLESLVTQINETGNLLFINWSLSHSDALAELSVKELEQIIEQYRDGLSRYYGPLGWLLRLLMAKRFGTHMKLPDKIVAILNPLTLRDRFWDTSSAETVLISSLVLMQDLICQRQELLATKGEIAQSQLEVGASLDKLHESGGKEAIQQRMVEKELEIERYKGYITDLGQGNYEAGNDIANEQRSIRDEMFKLRGIVNRDMTTLLACLPKLEGCTEDKINRSLLTVRRKKHNCIEKLRIYRNPLYSLNESTRALVFQGKEKAVDFMFSALQLLHSLESGVPLPHAAEQLPPRIARAMKDWWENVQDLEVTEKYIFAGERQSGGNIRKPVLYFNNQERVIKVSLPSEPVLFDRDNICGQGKFIARGKSGLLSEDILLVRKLSDGGYRTDALERLLESPEPVYNFQFSCGVTKREWSIYGPGWINHSIMFNSNGALVENSILPGDGAWLIAPDGCVVEPATAVKERGSLFDGWSGYESIYVDLDGVEVLMIRYEDNIDVYRKQENLEPTLIGGDKIRGVTGQDGSPMYKSGLPGIAFSISHPDELALYALKIEHNGGYFYKSADQLHPVLSKTNIVYIDMGRLFEKNFGDCAISLSYRNHKSWGCNIIVLPDLKISYPQSVYPLVEGTPDTSRLTLSSSIPFVFSPQGETLDNYRYTQIVSFNTAQNAISGETVFNLGDEDLVKAAVIYDIPCIRWRRVGETEWLNRVEEMWHGDLCEIEVKVPITFQGSIQLVLRESRQAISRPVKGGVAVFDLNKFADSLRSSRQPVQEVDLVFTGSPLPSNLLMRVRNRWQVDILSFEEKEEDNLRVINLSWVEHGKPENRVVRLWPMNISGSKMCEYSLPDGLYSFEIKERSDKLLPGKYLLQFDEEDLWASSQATYPEAGTRNCFDVQLGEVIESSVIKWRLTGARNWHTEPRNLWHQFLGNIELLLPEGLSGEAVQIVCEGRQILLNCIEGKRYEADLSAFRKVVSSNSAHQYRIQIAVSGNYYELITVCSDWEVYDVESHVLRDGDKWEFHVSWRETCNAAGRIIRIWSEDFKEYKEWPIPNGEDTKVIIREPIQGFYAGRYILQFAIRRSSSSPPEVPNLDGKNKAYLDVPYILGQASQLERDENMIINKFHTFLEYKCPKHNFILPSGIRRCSFCNYQLPDVAGGIKSFWLMSDEEVE